jgi:dTDP-4-dehydrorhamnose reductase
VKDGMIPRTIVIGAAGFVGRHLLAAYRDVDPAALGTARRREQARDGLAYLDLEAPDVRPLDLERRGCQAAVITAAVTQIAACEDEPARSHAVNVTGTLELIRQLEQCGVLPIFLSSDYVFDGQRSEGYDDAASPCPNTEYGRQKAAVEAALRDNGRPYLVLRLSKTYGVSKGDGTLLDAMAARLTTGQPVAAAHDQVFCPTWVGDVVRTVMEVQRRGLRGEINVSATQPWSRYEVARAVASAVKAPPELVHRVSLEDLPGMAGRPQCIRLIPARLARETECRFTPMQACLRWLAEEYGHE